VASVSDLRYLATMTTAFDIEIDCEGLLCPLPVLRARKRLLAMEPGQILQVRATDRMAAIDLPHFCRQAGHDFLDATPDGPVTRYRIRRG
jgi:tRNA 2-thiouridine synthesizing protein A